MGLNGNQHRRCCRYRGRCLLAAWKPPSNGASWFRARHRRFSREYPPPEADAMDIHFRGKTFRCAKSGPGTARSVTPEDAVGRMLPFLETIGVTRVADITGLTRTGLPVFNVVRPNLKVPSVSHGKGLTRYAAMASACGEAIERYHCFAAVHSTIEASYRRLEKEYTCVPIDRLPLSKHSLFNADVPECWVLGWDIVHQEEAAVPFALVNLGRAPGSFDAFSFQRSSNGFAAGVEFLEAACQALFEVIERDAIACTELPAWAQGMQVSRSRVQLDTIAFPSVRELIEQIEAADMFVMLINCTVDTAVPTYQCWTADRRTRRGGITHGGGTSLDPETAMIRAITEAVMAGACLHVGTRDAISRSEYFHTTLADTKGFIARYQREPCTVDARDLASEATDSFEEDIHVAVGKLRKAGLDQVIVVDLTVPEFDGAAARVIVPGLEGYHHFPMYAPSYRARRYLEEVGR